MKRNNINKFSSALLRRFRYSAHYLKDPSICSCKLTALGNSAYILFWGAHCFLYIEFKCPHLGLGCSPLESPLYVLCNLLCSVLLALLAWPWRHCVCCPCFDDSALGCSDKTSRWCRGVVRRTLCHSPESKCIFPSEEELFCLLYKRKKE